MPAAGGSSLSTRMGPGRRRVLQAALYEGGAIALVAPALAWVFERPAAHSLFVAVLMSMIALIWNWVFNALFERWEARQAVRGRSARRRIAHGIGFEGGLALLLVPVMAEGMDIGWSVALLADLALLAFFLVYTVAFTWLFDRIFGLPASAR